MRPDIKKMKERLDYFDHQLDLEIAHWRHAEREIERLSKMLTHSQNTCGSLLARNMDLEKMATNENWNIVLVSNLREEIKRSEEKIEEEKTIVRELFKKHNEVCNHLKIMTDCKKTWEDEAEKIKQENDKLKEENYWLKQSVETENDRLERNDELTKENAILMRAIKTLNEDIKTTQKEKERLIMELAHAHRDEIIRPLEGSHYCYCGAVAYIHFMLDGGKYYCGNCFKHEVIKL